MITRVLILITVLTAFLVAEIPFTDASFTGNQLIIVTDKPNYILDCIEFYPKYVELCEKQSNQISILKEEVHVYKLKERNRDKIDTEKTGIAKLSKKKRIAVCAIVITGLVIISYGGGAISGVLLSRRL